MCAVFWLEPNEVVRVRRCLQFGGIDAPLKKTRIKSPSKVSFTPKKLKTSFEPLAEFTTPSKATGMFFRVGDHLTRVHSFYCIFYQDQILAPETPSRLRSDNKNKKTDRIHVVGESPEIKQEGKIRVLLCNILSCL